MPSADATRNFCSLITVTGEPGYQAGELNVSGNAYWKPNWEQWNAFGKQRCSGYTIQAQKVSLQLKGPEKNSPGLKRL